MKSTMWVPVGKLVQLQELVKAHDLRFCENPFLMADRAMVTISSDHLPTGGGNDFWEAWRRLATQITETVRKPSIMTALRRMVRRG